MLDVNDVDGTEPVIRAGSDAEAAEWESSRVPGHVFPPLSGQPTVSELRQALTGAASDPAPRLALVDAAAVASSLRGAVDVSVGPPMTSVVYVVRRRRVSQPSNS